MLMDFGCKSKFIFKLKIKLRNLFHFLSGKLFRQLIKNKNQTFLFS